LLTRNHRQEGLCRAYVQAVAARCRMIVSYPGTDYGIDMTLSEVTIISARRFDSGNKLDIQAKSVSRSRSAGGGLQYDLDIRAYEVLRYAEAGTPRILVVLALPEKETAWLAEGADRLCLRGRAYWLSLLGSPPTPNRRSVRLVLPRANRFSTRGLQAIMGRIKAGEKL
jgi:hypothetical protein